MGEAKASGRTLVIVESPAKAKTIGKYLGTSYVVRASMGHVRDLPAKGLGIDVEDGSFSPQYELAKGRYKTVSEIRALAKEASQVLLATDPDREGEAIAWHIVAAAGLNRAGQSVRRVEFHEITESAIRAAIAHPRSIDMNLVDAQQARRVLDRLVGYKVSPLLWKKIGKGLSAGRVQSVALRVIVEREREIERFIPREFWTVEADLAKQPFSGKKFDIFRATLYTKEGKKREFEKGDEAKRVVTDLQGAKWSVARVLKKQGQRRPSAPFTTSTLQQEASRKLRLQNQDTMRIAQQLYEGVSLGAEGNSGLITYMRTDSTQVASEAQRAARDVIQQIYGSDFLPDRPPFYATKAKGAQEAHEACRPTKPEREPDKIKQYLSPQQYLLYRLIWRRFIASQMAPAIVEQTIVDVAAQPADLSKEKYNFRATGERVVFPGFMAVYRESRGDTEGDEPEEEIGNLPKLEAGDLLDLIKLLAEQHFTQPPPRYGEATLVKTLEELGVGRPSTYASILGTIQDRGYVVKKLENKERKFSPTKLGRVVTDLLVARFPNVLDVKFTAKMEEELDEVAEGKRAWTPLIRDFYTPLMEQLASAEREVEKIAMPEEDLAPRSASSASSFRGKSRGSGKSWGNNGSKSYGSRASSPAASLAKYDRRPKSSTSTDSDELALAAPKTTRTRRTTKAANLVGGEEAATPKTTRTRRSTKIANTSETEAAFTPKTTRTRGRAAPEQPSLLAPATSSAAEAVSAENCPLCGKAMVKRKGPYGEFFGCSGYPKCRGVRKF